LLVKQHKKDISFIIDNSLCELTIDRIAREKKFMIRKGKVPPSCFVNTLLFNENDMANTSLPDLTADLNQVYNIDISKEAMHKKFTPACVEFFKGLLAELLCGQLCKETTGKTLPLHFARIKIKDSTKFSLPDNYNDDYKGYGNFSKKNGLMSLQYEYDLVSSSWLSFEMTKGLRNDQKDSTETIGSITKGDLHVRDLGYITPAYLCAVVGKQAFFLNRLPPQCLILTKNRQPVDWKKTDAHFKKHSLTNLELDVLIYEKNKIPCRLLIEPVSNIEYCRRLKNAVDKAKSRGAVPSQLLKITLKYNLFITNVPSDILPFEVIRKTYYLRWQIELVFKSWKSFFKIDRIKKVKKERLECQLLAKLMWILINWELFRSLNKHLREQEKNQGVSLLIFFKRCIKFAASFRLVLLRHTSIISWLKLTYLPLIKDCLCDAPKNKQTHYESLKVNCKKP
jgi:hypothetical protein